MSLGAKRRAFTKAQAHLVIHAHMLGFEIAGKDWHRAASCGYGAKNSVHRSSLAIDFDLYIEGKWVPDGEHPAWSILHEFWELYGGAKAIPGDANHFSFEYNGMR